MTVTAKGFRSSRTNNVEMNINAVARYDLKSQVGELSETVTVKASAAVLQTDTADVHVSSASRQITELPLLGYRNYEPHQPGAGCDSGSIRGCRKRLARSFFKHQYQRNYQYQ